MTIAQLRKFCCKHNYVLFSQQYPRGLKQPNLLANPFSRGAHTYAMDGKICIRVPMIDAIAHDDAYDTLGKRIEDIFARLPVLSHARLIPLPALPTRPPYSERRRWPEPRRLMIGNLQINSEYLWKISFLPNIRISTDLTRSDEPLQFAFRGGDGFLMPMKPAPNFKPPHG